LAYEQEQKKGEPVSNDLRSLWEALFGRYPIFNQICPFHPDGNASLKVYDDHFHCFGCGAHGDGIDLVMKTHKMGYKEAKAFLEKRGYLLECVPPSVIEEKRRIREEIRAFERNLKNINALIDLFWDDYEYCEVLLREVKNNWSNINRRKAMLAGIILGIILFLLALIVFWGFGKILCWLGIEK
jgi:hypothetical protein